jgi:hypothetical protein
MTFFGVIPIQKLVIFSYFKYSIVFKTIKSDVSGGLVGV